MNWKFLPAALLGALMVVAGCSSSRIDPAAKQKAADSAEMMALKQDNDALRQSQQDSQAQIEALTKQLAADREEQRRFREMMSTNFDLLEQSVSASLAKAMDKSDKGAATMGPGNGPSNTPPTTPTGSASTDMNGPHATMTASSNAPRLAPIPMVGAPAGSTTASQETPLLVPGAVADDMIVPPTKPVTKLTQPSKPGYPTVASVPKMVNPSAKPSAAGTSTAAKPLTAALVGSNGKPYQDPDLDDPAAPRTLTANRAAKPLYEKGFVLFGNRQYEQSILVYQNFLTRYPDDIYSDNAQFWIGEAYLRMDKLADAEAAYRKVLREYAHKSTLEGYKTPDAIYRIGQIFSKRNNDKLARYYLQQVVQRFPDSSAGRKAQRDLDSGNLTSAVAADFGAGG